MTGEVAVYLCGSNEHASLCLPRVRGTATPERLLALRSLYARCVGAGDGWSACATSGGVLYAWGRNELPLPIGELPSGCSALACGPSKAYLLTDDGEVFVWRYATKATAPERVQLPVDVVQISCGGAHVMALSDNGVLFSWGRGTEGQLGRSPPPASKDPSPKRVEGLETTVVAVACGYAHSALVTAAGRLLGCGVCSCLALPSGGVHRGGGAAGVQPTPVEIPGPWEEGEDGLTSVACGRAHTLALSGSGRLYTFGEGGYGQLGHSGGSRPTRVMRAGGSLATVAVDRVWASPMCDVSFARAQAEGGEEEGGEEEGEMRCYMWGRLPGHDGQVWRLPEELAELHGKEVVDIVAGPACPPPFHTATLDPGP